LDLEIHAANPVLVGLLAMRAFAAKDPPLFKIKVRELPVFLMNDLGQVAAQEAKCPADSDDVNG
jgi:hypothetical protein